MSEQAGAPKLRILRGGLADVVRECWGWGCGVGYGRSYGYSSGGGCGAGDGEAYGDSYRKGNGWGVGYWVGRDGSGVTHIRDHGNGMEPLTEDTNEYSHQPN